MTLKTISEIAGVSVSTVSKAFSGSDEISDATRERIFNIAKEHGCFEHYNKNKFRKKIIAVTVPELNSAYYNSTITVLNNEINARGCIMITAVTNFNSERENELFDYFSAHANVDGIIMLGMHHRINNAMNLPTVIISAQKKGKNVDNIVVTRQDGILDAVLHLKELGHTKIGYAGEFLTESTKRHFINSLIKASLPVNKNLYKVSNKRFEEAGRNIALEWIREGEIPTAILAAYDNIAIGLMKEFKDHGIRVPEDVSIVGIDDIAINSHLSTSLSSVHTHNDIASKMAVDILMKKIDNQYYKEREEIIIKSEFIARESTSTAPSTKRSANES